jgi:site-specific recombinase XerC
MAESFRRAVFRLPRQLRVAPPPEFRPRDPRTEPPGVTCAGLSITRRSPGPSDAGTPSTDVIERVRKALRARHYSRRTEKAYVAWIQRFRDSRPGHALEALGAPQIAEFLSGLAIQGRVSASTQNQAFSALLFLYREVFETELAGLETVARAKRPERRPQTLTRREIAIVLNQMHGTPRLMAALMYGAGLRVLECVQLRVKGPGLHARRAHRAFGKGWQGPRDGPPGAADPRSLPSRGAAPAV